MCCILDRQRRRIALCQITHDECGEQDDDAISEVECADIYIRHTLSLKRFGLAWLHSVQTSNHPLSAAMETLPLTAASIIKCHVTPPRLTYREIVDDLLSFAKVLPRRWVHPKQTGRKAIALPPSVQLPLFDFVERMEANRKMQADTKLTSFTKATPRRRMKITNSVVNREVYMKEREEVHRGGGEGQRKG